MNLIAREEEKIDHNNQIACQKKILVPKNLSLKIFYDSLVSTSGM